MNVSDYTAKFLADKKIKHVFGITGGTIVYLFDSLARTPNIEYICTHHEQAAAIAADAYARVSGNMGVAITTSGPGATNLLTGVCCAYFDSIPALFITGQVSSSLLRKDDGVRQSGFQETDVPKIYSSVTKYVSIIDKAEKIRYELEKAVCIAKHKRPGPVMLDLPEDIQLKNVDSEKLEGYTIPHSERKKGLEQIADQTMQLIDSAKKPVVIIGAGARLRGLEREIVSFVEKLSIPVALTWGALDILPYNHPLSVRDFGITAGRTGNYAVQNADLILALGTRLDTHQIGNNPSSFAPEAKKIIVDIDEKELAKHSERGMKGIELLVNADLGEFLDLVSEKLGSVKKDIGEWRNHLDNLKKEYPSCPASCYSSKKEINPYAFIDTLSEQAEEGDIIIPEAGCNVTWSMQSWKVKPGQRVFSSFNHSPMGYGLPASIGASFASNKGRVIAIVGDGGLMMNEHEMATISHHNLPVKIFVLNNQGYGMIKQTQKARVWERYEACSKKHFHLPEPIELARAHGIKQSERIDSHSELRQKIKKVLAYREPVLCDVRIHPDSIILRKVLSGKTLDQIPLDDEN